MTVKSHAVYYCYLGSIGVRRETQRAGLCIRSLAAAALAARSRLGIRASLAAVVTCVYHNKEDYVNKNQNGSQTTYFTSFYSDECSKFTQGLFQKLFGFQRPIWTAKLQSTGCRYTRPPIHHSSATGTMPRSDGPRNEPTLSSQRAAAVAAPRPSQQPCPRQAPWTSGAKGSPDQSGE